jgi:hypothetical protein
LTTLSQPFDAIKVMDADVSLEVYVLPSIHVKLPQAVTTSVDVTGEFIVKSKVTILSQPFAADNVVVAVSVLAV